MANAKANYEISSISRNSATVPPQTRRALNSIWVREGVSGQAPIQFLKGLLWLAEIGKDPFIGTVELDKVYTRNDFVPRLNLPADFGICFNNMERRIDVYNKYGNLDYKTLAIIFLMGDLWSVQNGHNRYRRLNPEDLKANEALAKGLNTFNDAAETRTAFETHARAYSSYLDSLTQPFSVMGKDYGSSPTISVYEGPYTMFPTAEAVQDATKLDDILAEKYGIAGLDAAKFKGPALAELVLNLKLSHNSILVGPTGTGKSECVLEAFRFADADRDVQVIEGHESLREIDLLGGHVPGTEAGKFEWADGVLVKAMRNGSFLFVDEANRMPTRTLNVLLGVLSRRAVVLTDHGSEEVECNDGFTVVMAMNQGQGYAVNGLDRALIDRFPETIEFYYLNSDDETALVRERTGIDDRVAKLMVKLGNDVREMARIGEFESGISPRGLFAWAQKYTALTTTTERIDKQALVTAAKQTWIRGVAGVGVDGYMERDVVQKLSAMIYDAR